MEGFITLHRKLLNWEWYDDVNTSRLFIHCLLRANHKDNNWRGINVKRGQFISSLSKLASETSLTVKQIRTSLKKLNSTNEVASKGQSQHTVFTINNYDLYQSEGKQKASEGQAEGKRRATNNNDNNENNDNNSLDQSKIDREKLELDSFDYWWKAYPKKQAKPAAFKAWKKAIKKMDTDKVRSLTNHIVDDCKLRMDDLATGSSKFIGFDNLNGSTYINQERYNDDI